jgi:ABC-2 type transport system permease protein
MYWSVRRELWENRSIYVAPLAVAAVALFGFFVSSFTLPQRMRAALALDPARQAEAIHKPYSVVAGLVLLTAFVVGVFYCLDCLYGERRDRSILFWKSLPVSDRTTVLSKALIVLVVLPLYVFALIVVTHTAMLLLNTVVLLPHGPSVEMLWARLPFVERTLMLLYGVVVLALWHAPLYAWLLVVSVWSRRTPFLWAVLPPFALSVVEKIAFNSWHFASLLKDRFIGGILAAFNFKGHVDDANAALTPITPGRFLATPGLWLGLGAAAIADRSDVTSARRQDAH